MLNFIVWVVYFYNLFVGMCIPTYMHALGCHGTHMEVRGQFAMSVFFLPIVGSRNQTRVIRFGRKHLYLLSLLLIPSQF